MARPSEDDSGDSSTAAHPPTRFGLTRLQWLAVGVTVLAAVVATVVTTRLFPFHSINHDEGVYLGQAAMLTEGQLFVRPPVEEVFRPWFFVERPDGALYPKYAPVPAATFALGSLLGSPRIGLVAVTAAVTALTYALGATLFDRQRGVVAAALLLTAPLFLIHSGVFLPYAATTVWNLLFAVAYVRADRAATSETDETRGPEAGASRRITDRWAAVAGVAVGVAFFSRPYTAVLFAAPFVLHAVWSLWQRRDRATLRRQVITAVGGTAGVAAALGYNAVVTGDPLLFPYQAFAPLDGIGFGEREILGYERDYTVGLALRANAAVVWQLFTRWVSGGAVGTLLAAVGLIGLLREWRGPTSDGGQQSTAGAQSPPPVVTRHRLLLAATLVTVIGGNVAFWGNLNVLGDLDRVGDGLIASLGPYYHYDLLVPTAVFAADGLRRVRQRTTAAVATRRREDGDTDGQSSGLGGWALSHSTAHTVVSLLLAVAVVTAGAAAAAQPVTRNANATETYRSAYEPFLPGVGDGVDDSLEPTASTDAPPPFDSVGRPALSTPADAVVTLPRLFGDWLVHPYQPLRNDPGFDGQTVYALRGRPFAVADAYPDRRLFRYVSRGVWNPQAGATVDASLQPVVRREGERLRLSLSLGVPREPESVSVRLGDDDGQAYYGVDYTHDAGRTESARLSLAVTLDATAAADDSARVELRGPVVPVGQDNISVSDRDTVTLTVFLDDGTGAGFSYRLELPVDVSDGRVRSLSPLVSVCRNPTRCDGASGYVPDAAREGVVVEQSLQRVSPVVEQSPRRMSAVVEQSPRRVSADDDQHLVDRQLLQRRSPRVARDTRVRQARSGRHSRRDRGGR
jgi:hypothetical protein